MYKYPKRGNKLYETKTKNISSPTKGVEEKTEWFQPISSFEDLSRWITMIIPEKCHL